MPDSRSTIFGAVVHNPDRPRLKHLIERVVDQVLTPKGVIVADNDGSEKTRQLLSSLEKEHDISIQHVDSSPNRGFNPGYNSILERALKDENARFLATMTVRNSPDSEWLLEATKTLKSDSEVGAVATVQRFRETNDVFGIGHHYRRDGGLLDFGRGRSIESLRNNWADQADKVVWGPCTGAGLYLLEALRDSQPSEEWLDPYQFKGYNCNVIAWYLRQAQWKVDIAWDAVAHKNVSESTSHQPGSSGLLISQELNRIQQVLKYWPTPERDAAIDRYLHRPTSRISDLDKRIVVTRARGCFERIPLPLAQSALRRHLDCTDKYLDEQC